MCAGSVVGSVCACQLVEGMSRSAWQRILALLSQRVFLHAMPAACHQLPISFLPFLPSYLLLLLPECYARLPACRPSTFIDVCLPRLPFQGRARVRCWEAGERWAVGWGRKVQPTGMAARGGRVACVFFQSACPSTSSTITYMTDTIQE